MDPRTESLWRATHPVGGFARLPGNLDVDVAVVGGGISGLTAAEQTWDCPCHGSRFSPDGTVVNGPAVNDLRRIPVTTPVR